jgi:hypothetical protein
VALRLPEGQTIMARQLQIPAVIPDVNGENTANTMQEMLGAPSCVRCLSVPG